MAASGFSIALVDSIKIGPWGDKGTPNYDVPCAEIIEIIVYAETIVNGLVITYYDAKGNILISETGSLVGESKKVELERGEYINWVSGSYINYDDQICMSDLVFKTNKLKEHGPFRHGVNKIVVENPETFTVDVVGGKIIGIFGQSDTYINSIGFYLATVTNTASVIIK